MGKVRRQGSVIQKGPGRWLIRWYDGRTGSERKYRSKYVKGSRRDALRELNRVLGTKDQGTYVAPSRITFDQLCEQFYATMESTRAISERTLALYRGLLDKHVRPVLGEMRVVDIRQPDVQACIAGMGERAGRRYASHTIDTVITALRRVFSHARDAGIIVESPVRKLDLPTPDQAEVRTFSRDEIRRFRKHAAGDRFEALYDFLLATGCRPGEALALRWADLDLERQTVHFHRTLTRDAKGRYFAREGTKTRTRRDPSHGVRVVPLPPQVCDRLVEHRKAQAVEILKVGPVYDRAADLVWATEAGTPLNIDHIRKRYYQPVCEAAEVEGATMYSLRHTCATRLLEAGHSPRVISERLGNSPEMVLRTYTRATQSMQDAATDELAKLLYEDQTPSRH